MFGNDPEIYDSQVEWRIRGVQNVENDFENFPTPEQDSTEGHLNISSNKERSHKMIWKLPDKCFEDKCDACRNNSCCSFGGLFLNLLVLTDHLHNTFSYFVVCNYNLFSFFNF